MVVVSSGKYFSLPLAIEETLAIERAEDTSESIFYVVEKW
jgi:hypothetical protein